MPQAVYLVGGFAVSPKAVADGAILFYIDGHVTSRLAPITIGAPLGVLFNAFEPDYVRRTKHHCTLSSGRIVVTGGFDVLLEKVISLPRSYHCLRLIIGIGYCQGTFVTEETEIWRPFSYEATATLSNLSLDVIAYTGRGKPPKWIDEFDNSSEQVSLLLHL